MGSWHYQVMKHTEDTGEVWYGIHEVYPSLGESYTETPVEVWGESVKDIKWQLKAILNDLEKYPVVDYD